MRSRSHAILLALMKSRSSTNHPPKPYPLPTPSRRLPRQAASGTLVEWLRRVFMGSAAGHRKLCVFGQHPSQQRAYLDVVTSFINSLWNIRARVRLFGWLRGHVLPAKSIWSRMLSLAAMSPLGRRSMTDKLFLVAFVVLIGLRPLQVWRLSTPTAIIRTPKQEPIESVLRSEKLTSHRQGVDSESNRRMQNLLKLKSATPPKTPCGSLRKSSLLLPASLFLLSVLPGCGSQTASEAGQSSKPVPKYLLSKLKSP